MNRKLEENLVVVEKLRQARALVIMMIMMMMTMMKMMMMMMMIRMNVVPESRLLARRWAARPPDQGGAVSQRPIAQSL